MNGEATNLTAESGRGVLDRARAAARLSSSDLWVRYLALGGERMLTELWSYLSGQAEPSVRDYNLLVDALNERLTDLGLAANVRYAA